MDALPQLSGRQMVTDGGLETELIFRHRVDLPEFAAYPLLGDDAGRRLLTDYYDAFAAIAARAGAGLLLEAPTWRANPDWGARLGHSLPTWSAPTPWPSTCCARSGAGMPPSSV
ncbi:hypothetical protein [Terrabacter carboxydivorans]|uniref:Homocysteine S-methyltransferase n=1 Tax=Terrabacter carboxydivorans TaxID=619730 RepID=A0ABN3LCW1_9MICO